MDLVLRGGCRCDAVRFEIAQVYDAGYCHCSRCRKWTGAPLFAFVLVPRTAVTWLSGELQSEPRETLGWQIICATCRGAVCFDLGDRDLQSFGVGLLDEPARIRPTFHQCVNSKLPWVEIDDRLPRFDENTVSHPGERLSPIAPENAQELD